MTEHTIGCIYALILRVLKDIFEKLPLGVALYFKTALSKLFDTRNQFDGRQFFSRTGFRGLGGGGLGMVQCITSIVHFINYYYISSTLDHQALDPGGRGPVP